MRFCSLYSGSSGNSVYINSGESSILVDAGLPGKSILSALESIGEEASSINAILISHEHIDHIKGAGILSRKLNIPIYANEKTWKAMEKSIGNIREENIKVIHGNFTIGDFEIRPFKVPHDAAACIGFTLEDSMGKTASTVTDMGVFTKEIRDAIKDSQIVLIESNHDVEMLKFGPYPYELKRRVLSEIGHLSNEDCAKALLTILDNSNKKVALGHLSGTNNVPELAFKTVESILIESGVKIGSLGEVELKLASRIRPSSFWEL